MTKSNVREGLSALQFSGRVHTHRGSKDTDGQTGSLEVTSLWQTKQRKGTGSGLKTGLRNSPKGAVTSLTSATCWETGVQIHEGMGLESLVYTDAVTVTKASRCCENSGGTSEDLSLDSGHAR